MERIFCETKRILAILVIALIISTLIVPISKAAYSDSMREGNKYEYKGILLISYRTKDGAKKDNIFKIKGVLTKGDKITIQEIDGNILKIGNNEYIKLSVLNSGSKFKLISENIEEPQPQPQPQPQPPVEEPEEELVPQEEPEPQPQPQPQPPVEIVRVSGIELNKNQGNLYKELGWKYKLKATIKPENATNKNIKWTSDNTKVLTVDENGNITGKSIGTATITATTEDGGFKATCKVRVTKLEINKTKLTLNIGEKSDLEVRYVELNKTTKKKDIDWTSSNTKVAKVDTNGKVTAIGKGTATITAKAQHANIKLECKVTVNEIKVKGVKIEGQEEVKLGVGGTCKLKATINPENATNKAVTWTSSNKKVAEVDANGKVKALKEGTATITVKTKDGSKKDTCKIVVIKKVNGVKLDKTSLDMYIGQAITLKATVSPTNASNKKVKWISKNEKVAKVDANGKVTAVGVGNTKITVITEDGNFTKDCTVNVDPYKYYFGDSVYKLAIKKDKLEEVVAKIDEKNIEQTTQRTSNYGLAGKCGQVSTYYIRMLYGQVKLSVASRAGAYYQSTAHNGTINSLSAVKSKVDDKVLTRLHLESDYSTTHWAVVIGYKNNGTSKYDLLLLDPVGGNVVKFGSKYCKELYNEKWEARVYNKP